MQFLTSLFGADNTLITALLALGIVLVLIVLGVWLLKLVFSASSNIGRGRNRRLSVVDTLALDPKRQLVIVRRDNVEHLLLVGGPQDIVVEGNIAAEEAPAAPQQSRRPIPMVGGRRPSPAPAQTPPPAAPAAPATALEQLRQSGQPTDRKQHLSLRHTGLLRPVDENRAVSPENGNPSGRPADDSAKEDGAQRQVEGGDFGQNGGEARQN